MISWNQLWLLIYFPSTIFMLMYYLILVPREALFSHNFRSLNNHKSCKLNKACTIEVAKKQFESTLEILSTFLLTPNNHVFHVNLIPMTIGSFYMIIGMDWLPLHQAKILCHKKVVRLPLPNNKALMTYRCKLGKNLGVTICMNSRKHCRRDASLSWPT